MDDDPSLDFGLDPQGERTVGWVARHFDTDKCGDGQCKLQKYMTSFYWAVMTMTTVCLPSRNATASARPCRCAVPILRSGLTLVLVAVYVQVGYGDITPHTKYEMAACIVSMIIGGFIFGTIVGNLAELSKRANADELMRQKAVSRVQTVFNSGLARGAITPDLIRRIKSYYRFQHEQNTTVDLKAFIFALTPDLRDEMAEQLHWIDGVSNGRESFGLLHKVPFFTGLSNIACINICATMKIRHLLATPEDPEMIMEEGADCEEMYVVVEGSRAVVLERDGVKLGYLSTGDFFGELGALLPPEMKQQRRRTRTAYAVAEMQAGVLSYDDLMKLRRERFEVNKEVTTYTSQVLTHLRSADGPGAASAVTSVSMLDRTSSHSLH